MKYSYFLVHFIQEYDGNKMRITLYRLVFAPIVVNNLGLYIGIKVLYCISKKWV